MLCNGLMFMRGMGGWAQLSFYPLSVQLERRWHVSRFHTLSGYLANDRSKRPLQLPHTCLPGVLLDEKPNQGNRDFQVAGPKSMIVQEFWDEVRSSDLHFLGGGITWKFDDFETIPKRRMNWIEPVGSRDEKDVA